MAQPAAASAPLERGLTLRSRIGLRKRYEWSLGGLGRIGGLYTIYKTLMSELFGSMTLVLVGTAAAEALGRKALASAFLRTPRGASAGARASAPTAHAEPRPAAPTDCIEAAGGLQDTLLVGLAFGLAILAGIYASAHNGAGHFNPVRVWNTAGPVHAAYLRGGRRIFLHLP